MSYLLDTNVLSEIVRIKPDPYVLEWFKTVSDDLLHISVLSLGEIRKGVEKITDVARKEKLRLWLEQDLIAWFGSKILSIDRATADRWGRLQHHMGRPLPAIDSLLAATALEYDLRIVTRNTVDFQYPSLEVINPFKAVS